MYYVFCDDLDMSPMQYVDIVKMAKERKRGKKRTEETDDPQRGRLQPPKYGLAAKADPAKRPRKGQSQSSSSQAAASSQPVPLHRRVPCLETL